LINATDNKTTHGRFAAPARDEFKIDPKKNKNKIYVAGAVAVVATSAASLPFFYLFLCFLAKHFG